MFICSFPKRQLFRLFQTEEFADNNFIFDENGRTFSKRVENTVAKGEIARYEQFLLFPTVFSKDLQTRKNQGLFGKGLNRIPHYFSYFMEASGPIQVIPEFVTVHKSFQAIGCFHVNFEKLFSVEQSSSLNYLEVRSLSQR